MSNSDPNSGQPDYSAGSPVPPTPPTPDMYAPPAPYQTPGYAYQAQPPMNSMAIIAFVSSLVGMFVLPLIASIVAVITGHISLKQLKSSGESGRALALSGTIIGWVGVGIWALVIVGFLIFFVFAIGIAASTSNGYYS
ncbi:hypothetical protein FHX49_002338 [Microbacterium endophyticum]|uniref:DUF4190 domain-containing protein n=1 Tax=Microbacterium endophyticum TaxID=1526412 RepID=A0A7W4V4M7_9MICO|nr:DUF4190 domain-containing protein [Microbacterium endophyticum]MBB2976752.1 hypothetical protein [Microbacterium endophyticum]NIK36612.1 hypothetical protein [Microbacterium endophyticum]